jgi:hypothetical protein
VTPRGSAGEGTLGDDRNAAQPDASQAQVAAFTRQTRMRRLGFAGVAFGVAAAAVVGALALFGGGGLQTASRSRAGLAADDLRRALSAQRERCQGLWKVLFAVDWPAIPEARSRSLTAQLSASELSCEDVAALARQLPQRRGEPRR